MHLSPMIARNSHYLDPNAKGMFLLYLPAIFSQTGNRWGAVGFMMCSSSIILCYPPQHCCPLSAQMETWWNTCRSFFCLRLNFLAVEIRMQEEEILYIRA